MLDGFQMCQQYLSTAVENEATREKSNHDRRIKTGYQRTSSSGRNANSQGWIASWAKIRRINSKSGAKRRERGWWLHWRNKSRTNKMNKGDEAKEYVSADESSVANMVGKEFGFTAHKKKQKKSSLLSCVQDSIIRTTSMRNSCFKKVFYPTNLLASLMLDGLQLGKRCWCKALVWYWCPIPTSKELIPQQRRREAVDDVGSSFLHISVWSFNNCWSPLAQQMKGNNTRHADCHGHANMLSNISMVESDDSSLTINWTKNSSE